ncbi:hypothetical protein [Metabacillus idriensis]|uniref:hypothetical protein n=1 Tax=Metabacillus idriensis TaxID=324768 RepID=UPI003D2E03F0
MEDFVLAEGLGGGAGHHRKAEPTVQARQADKDPAEKALFAFTDGAVLAEGLGGGARHHRKAQSTV